MVHIPTETGEVYLSMNMKLPFGCNILNGVSKTASPKCGNFSLRTFTTKVAVIVYKNRKSTLIAMACGWVASSFTLVMEAMQNFVLELAATLFFTSADP